MKQDMQIDKIILDYVSAIDTDYAIMIDGEWGAGKTWYWEKYGKRENVTSNNKEKCSFLSIFAVN